MLLSQFRYQKLCGMYAYILHKAAESAQGHVALRSEGPKPWMSSASPHESRKGETDYQGTTDTYAGERMTRGGRGGEGEGEA